MRNSKIYPRQILFWWKYQRGCDEVERTCRLDKIVENAHNVSDGNLAGTDRMDDLDVDGRKT
jgi:hypothetical protein